jgi:uncharacterized protein YfaP (DUF2135 family)
MRSLLVLTAVLLLPASSLPAREAPVSVRIESPRGGQTRDRIVTIRGTLSGYRGDRVTIALNGVPMTVPREGDAFSTTQVLAPGLNSIRASVEQAGVVASDEVAVHATVPAKDLRVTLTWDANATDVDLWVTGPDGEKVFYQHRQGAQGGQLDTDITTGFGPETYTQARAQPGAYHVQAHYYGGDVPLRCTVTVIQFEGTPDERREEMSGWLLKPGEVVEVGEFLVSR